MNQKFATTTESESAFSKQTFGLVSAQDQQNQHGSSIKPVDESSDPGEKAQSRKIAKKERKKRMKEKKKRMATLSFSVEDEDQDEGTPAQEAAPPVSFQKDPSVDTSFLPDKEREKSQKEKRAQLEEEWNERQECIKKEKLEIVYSYWDGSGHRRTVECQKGDTIGRFLELVRKDLVGSFEMDLMIPHDLTFYDLIVTKARGKSGPLFHFGFKEDIRIGAIDSRVETEESHPGKVVERRWYERNKHIFPASRWEVFDPTRDYGKYTIHGNEVNKKTK
eukprot:CAMPEP_0116865874 /NCGR_PEP_ID=MMETSP0418-20121206/25707_1 /TAXON_ID=1158023 /ORGANISM="Astrosyne radiata, Strain 13vi08-1A" /LENGTH=276 /DNA_ID=CAMNT_0004501429 /DNA_START=74 /DNA_END=905 /DNA_ORIENTATION=+